MNCTKALRKKAGKRRKRNMNKLLLIIIIVGCTTFYTQAQDYSIAGKSLSQLKSLGERHLTTPHILLTLPSQASFSVNSPKVPRSYPLLAEQKLRIYRGEAPTAFFCKLEYRLQKKAGFPIRFRLGEVNYQMRMEGKGF